MSEKNKKSGDAKEKGEQHKKSTNRSKVKKQATKNSEKNVQKTGSEHDDWNDPTGNTHLSDKS